MSESVYIGLGSNLGNREESLLWALQSLRRIDAVAVRRTSALYDSAPVGPAQPRFLNAVVELECGLSPQRLLGILKHIEGELGRRKGERWGPRPIDLDILLWEGRVVAEPVLQVPHLELHRRRFALEPLAELAGDCVHPVLGSTIRALLAQLEPQDVRRLASDAWPLAQLERIAS
ncbi:MAG: 2-amino-4-hydroxy-6-hydroxymethyldihydropteridine diphosphokinase [Myxococcaceae bacterium]|nr:2-amino-4-hydroxy-6-hydroxymethyldihydropteridine diphosphokinase [Myxococcaceae bacterium]MCI0669020.1 2-amino-4-hydroxy-6-hydroxymethyldihydropteridine diphosphokinase [Myxococcaceae bacterium]